MSSIVSVHSHLISPWDDHKSHNSSSSSKDNFKIPRSFVWELDDIGQPKEKLDVPVIDLEGFFTGDELAIQHASKLLRAACTEHGFFHVINHGVDPELLNEAYNCLDDFFKLPIERKLKALKRPGNMSGFIRAHADRFSTNLPWKETLSFHYRETSPNPMVVDYFSSVFGSDLEPMGMVYQKYCKVMTELAMAIMELLAISLGVERNYYRDFFQDPSSTMRCNYYPPCKEPSLVLGTGAHCDVNSLTILYQDQVGGLEVFENGKWLAVEPRSDALVVNIGDAFMALSNGKYKSDLHRVVVHKSKERKSMAFFFNPREDKLMRPPESISYPRKYPDFVSSDLVDFTQNIYRADDRTLESFAEWLLASKSQQSDA